MSIFKISLSAPDSFLNRKKNGHKTNFASTKWCIGLYNFEECQGASLIIKNFYINHINDYLVWYRLLSSGPFLFSRSSSTFSPFRNLRVCFISKPSITIVKWKLIFLCFISCNFCVDRQDYRDSLILCDSRGFSCFYFHSKRQLRFVCAHFNGFRCTTTTHLSAEKKVEKIAAIFHFLRI